MRDGDKRVWRKEEKKNTTPNKQMKKEKMMRRCQIHFVFKELGYESSYLKRGAGNRVAKP